MVPSWSLLAKFAHDRRGPLTSGVPPVAALAAATTAARGYLGLPSLSDGAPADVVTYHHDPREDPGVLSRPAAVLRGGHRIR